MEDADASRTTSWQQGWWQGWQAALEGEYAVIDFTLHHHCLEVDVVRERHNRKGGKASDGHGRVGTMCRRFSLLVTNLAGGRTLLATINGLCVVLLYRGQPCAFNPSRKLRMLALSKGAQV